MKNSAMKLLGPILIYVIGYVFLFISKGLGFASLFTVLSSLGIWGLYQLVRQHKTARIALAYAVFFITPILSLTGQIGVLTGFNGNSASLNWLGVSFVSAGIALFVYHDQLSFKNLLLNVMQPIRFNSGPVALTSHPVSSFSKKRWFIYFRWFVLGTFFFSVIASGLSQLLILKESTDALDVLIFAIVFEAYVYFNFVGITMMAYAVLNLFGVRTVLNFNSPFSARNVIEYWQRWHISLSTVLKNLFFLPFKKRFGLPIAIFFVFISSAMWHGVTLNFVIWGSFHAFAWVLTYYLLKMIKQPMIAKALVLFLFPIIVVLGRLIFSESDSGLLLLKFQQLVTWNTDPSNVISTHLEFDTKTLFTVLFAAALIAFEFICPKLAKKYQFLRHPYATVVWIALCIAFSSFGIEGVYGTR